MPPESAVTRETHKSAVVCWVKSECMYLSMRRGGWCRGTDAGIHSINPLQFHISYRSVQSEVNVKTLQINPESDRSSISCQRYHFPSKWYGWQFDNCHPDLASLKHSPKTHQIFQGRWDEITDSRNLPSLSKNTTICRDVYKWSGMLHAPVHKTQHVCFPPGIYILRKWLSCVTLCLSSRWQVLKKRLTGLLVN